MINYIKNPNISLSELLELYSSVEWFGYTNRPDMLKNSFDNSLMVIGTYQDKQLIGLIRIVGDGHSIIFIQDILVKPSYQRQKIGSSLLKMILDEFPNYYQIHLLTDNTEKTKLFYQSMGFKEVSDIQTVCFTYSN